ncbi:MAG: hypothetical protein IT308_00720 [Anaerolineaceae bacterium]|nr:hypothetical protein [Anaerolineaceae bacterium]
MLSSERLNAYTALLKIRQIAYRRNVLLTGAMLLAVLLATLAIGLLTPAVDRTLVLMAGFDIAFLLSFLRACTQLEIVKGNIELIDQLQDPGSG